MVAKYKQEEKKGSQPTMSVEDIEKLKKRSQQVVSAYGARTELYTRYREMFFMTDESRRPMNSKVDEKDWAITVSPSARNEVVGMVRLLDTSEIHVEVRDGNEPAPKSDKIEQALLTMLRVSGEFRRARVESDAALSAVLYGPVVMYSESVADVQTTAKSVYQKRQLERIAKRTPFLIRNLNSEQSFPEWGEFGLLSHTWEYRVRGAVLEERWGVKDVKPDQEYMVRDIYDCENRLVYVDGRKDVLFAGPHGLDTIPVVVRYAGGSSLFHKPEEQMQSFLYAKAKSRLDKRENAMLTAMATAVNVRGMMGPLIAIDPENAPQQVQVDFSGHIRTIKAKVQQVDDKVIDPVLFQWKNLLDELSAQSTIHRQTLGENISGSTFSALNMLSNAGKLPLVDMQRGIEMAFRDVFLNILLRIKTEGIENELISPQDIPDDIELDVTLEPDLAQDDLRNAQIVSQLKGSGANVSDEWINTNLLKIGDSNEMFRQKTKEELRKAIVGQIMQNPQVMGQFVQVVMGAPKTPPPAPPQTTNTLGEGSQEMPPEMMAQMQAQGGPPQGMMPGAGGEQMPMTDAMPMPSEMPVRGANG